jgi:AcrR family transcriptional regulator
MGLSDLNMRGVSAADGTTKAKIERAALILFANDEIDGVSTKQIAAKAGISEGAIYRHFPSKDALARSIMQTIHTRLTDMIHIARTEKNTLPEQVRFIVNHYCQIADDDWTLFQYHLLHLHHFSGLNEEPQDSPINAAAALLSEAMNRGHIKSSNPHVLASMSLGIVVQTAQAKVFGYIDTPLSEFAETFQTAILSVLDLTGDT